MKRWLSLLLVAVMIIAYVPTTLITVNSATTSNDIKTQVSNTYNTARTYAGVSNFNGWCGLLVNWQLVILGINSSYIGGDGNTQYDNYKNIEKTTGNYSVTAYPAATYNLKSALNQITESGTKDAYNILVGFETGYGTEGALYGHTVFVHGIINGTVYFCESFGLTIEGTYYPEGAVIACSIDAFSNYYNGWTTLDGVIHFENEVCSHAYSDTVTTAATCTSTGVKTYTCSKCGDSYTESILAIGHNYVGIKTEATCAVAAHTTYTCSVCGDSYVEQADSWSEWSEEYPEDISAELIEQKTQYSTMGKQYTTSSSDTLDGWTKCGTVYGDWGAVQTTTTKPTEGDTLRITNTVQTGWGYHHWCNNYGNSWGVDSISVNGSAHHHYCTTAFEIPISYISDNGGQQSYGGTGSGAPGCTAIVGNAACNFYYWFRNPSADVYTYSYQTRDLVNQFYRWDDEWSDWTDEEIVSNEDCQVKTRTVYRYKTSELKDHEYTCTEQAPTFTENGFITYRCANCGDTVTEEIPRLAGKVSGWNVTLRDDLQVNFHLSISESIENTARVRIVVGEEGHTFRVSGLEKTEDGLYIASVNIAAAQMTDFIFVTVINGSDLAETASYTVRGYADTILADEGYSQYHQLVREMLNYGAAAQVYFDYEEENLANEGITDTGSVEIPDSVDNELSVSGNAEGVTFYGASLIFQNKIAVRYYFRFKGDINDCRFAVNDTTYAPQLKDGLYYIDVKNILPQDLDDEITLTVTDAKGNSLEVCYNPMNYIVRMNEKGSAELQALVKALYNYHLAAKALA